MPKCALEGCDNAARIKFCCIDHKDKYFNARSKINKDRGYEQKKILKLKSVELFKW